jgi:hypothetical protein
MGAGAAAGCLADCQPICTFHLPYSITPFFGPPNLLPALAPACLPCMQEGSPRAQKVLIAMEAAAAALHLMTVPNMPQRGGCWQAMEAGRLEAGWMDGCGHVAGAALASQEQRASSVCASLRMPLPAPHTLAHPVPCPTLYCSAVLPHCAPQCTTRMPWRQCLACCASSSPTTSIPSTTPACAPPRGPSWRPPRRRQRQRQRRQQGGPALARSGQPRRPRLRWLRASGGCCLDCLHS